jgi:undecaprenyl diphosphate synthase
MHLGVIPDGNRRYADNHNLAKVKAYRKAKNVIAGIFDDIDDLPVEIEEATFYLLSEENLKRDEEDLQDLFNLMEQHISEIAERLNESGFAFNWVSTNPSAIPEHLQQKLRDLEDEFNKGEKTLNALISYSGKKDIVGATRQLDGEVSKKDLKENLEISSEIDYVVRTGDNPTRECLSGFPIWNSSYAEFYHLKKNFPAVTHQDVKEALEHFQKLRKKKGA